MRGLRRILVALASAVLLLVVLAALFPAALTGVDPLQTHVQDALQAPSGAHPFGTDQSGRDVYARVVHGAARSLGVGVLATGLALVIGLILGGLAGLAPRPVDVVVLRTNDVLSAFPEFLLALVVVAILGPGTANLAIGVTLAAVPVYVRLARVQTQVLRRAEHVEAARILGVPAPLAVLRHVVPGVLGSLSVLATIGLGSSILAAAGLSFLGLGSTEPAAEWGLMLASGRNVLGQAWWVSVFPGLAITLTVLASTFLGRTVRAGTEGRRP